METAASRWWAFLALLVVAACNESAPAVPPPLDRIYYPTGIALRHVPVGCAPGAAGCTTHLLVVSSNFDLRYEPNTGGTLIAVDVDEAVKSPGAPLAPPALLGTARIGSFGGEVAVVDATTCPGWTAPAQALVAARSSVELYRVGVADTGALTCDAETCSQQIGSGAGAEVGNAQFADPFSIAIACIPTDSGGLNGSAYVSYLRGYGPAGATDQNGFLSRFDLLTRRGTTLSLGANPTGSIVFDPSFQRLYVTERFGTVNYSPLRWLSLAAPAEPVHATNLFDAIRGAELRGLALSTDAPSSRLYVALRIYDATAATTLGARPAGDIAGALAVLDVTESAGGGPTLSLVRVVPLGRGPAEVRTIGRTGRRDLVLVTSTDDSTLTLYDDQDGVLAHTIGTCLGDAATDPVTPDSSGAPAPCDPGKPALGRQPFGLAVEQLSTPDQWRVFVGSFDRSWINVFQIDATKPGAGPVRGSWVRIGVER